MPARRWRFRFLLRGGLGPSSSSSCDVPLLTLVGGGCDVVDSQGTFYGMGGAGAAGACMLRPGFNGVGTSVAINQAQWDGGLTCGKCVRITGTGAGLGMTPIKGPIFATIDNLCPECKYGDIDLGLGGDGRWQINWDFVPCGRRSLRGGDLDWSEAEALVASWEASSSSPAIAEEGSQ
jgi:hypothetical protein